MAQRYPEPLSHRKSRRPPKWAFFISLLDGESHPPQRSRNGISRSTPLPIRTPAGGLPQATGPAAYSPPEAPALAEWEARDACGVVNVWVARRRSTIGGTRGAVAGTRRGGAGVRAA